MGRLSRTRLFPPILGILLLLAVVLADRGRAVSRGSRRPRSDGDVGRRVREAVTASTADESFSRRIDGPQDSKTKGMGESDVAAVVAYDPDRQDWAAAQAWLARAKARLAMEGAIADFDSAGICLSAWSWDPLTSDTLEKDLELTPPQKARIDEIRERYRREEEIWKSHSVLESEVDRKLEELRDRYRRLMRDELSPEQQKKFDEMAGLPLWNRSGFYLRAAALRSDATEFTDP